MKKMNLFVMGLLATAALTVSSCSSDDSLSPSTGQQIIGDGYYMTVSFPKTQATRTAQQEDKENGTAEESTITNGTIYIYDGKTRVFCKDLTASDWETNTAPNTIGTTKPFKVSINSVKAEKEYTVYFLANSSLNTVPYPMTSNLELAASSTGGAEYAKANKFVMFNQNDESKKAGHSKVIFTEASKNVANKVTAGDIYLDRVVARIDAPTVNNPEIKNKENVTTTKNINVIESVTYDGYTLTNMANKSYLVQNWTETATPWSLNIPGSMTYYKPNSYYGNEWQAENLADFTNKDVNYVFENTTTDESKATGMYYKFTVTLKDNAGKHKDFEDGTFYRYSHKIYTSLQDIMDDNEESWPFVDDNGKTVISIEDALKMIKGEVEGVTLADVRQKYHIDVFEAGAVYYKYTINDKFYAPTGYYSILRNSVYKLTVNNIWDLGKDVPNGPNPEEEYNYWMDVTVNVNPWVLNTIDVDLK